MKASKELACLLFVSLVCVGLQAESPKPMPTKRQIILVGKISIGCTIDDFYARTFKGGDATKPHSVVTKLAENSCVFAKNAALGGNGGEFFFLTLDKGDKIAVRIKGFEYLPFSIEEAYILLPFWKEFTVPREGQFFYIGSYVYDFDLKKLEVKGVESIDEYDAAQIAANKAFNADIPLQRVPLNDLAEY